MNGAALPAWRTEPGTRDTLHRYAQVLGAVRRALADPHPRWWHISLRVAPRGLATGEIAIADARGPLSLALDLERHELRGELGGESVFTADLTRAPTARALAASLGEALAGRGVALPAGALERASDEPASYEPAGAAALAEVFAAVRAAFERWRRTLDRELSPIQLWPHHFDLSFEQFGKRLIEHQEAGETVSAPAQIGTGLSTGDAGHPEPYFYSNPWPFDQDLPSAALPAGAAWHLEGWQGALLPYATAAARPGSLEAFLARVAELAAPGLD